MDQKLLLLAALLGAASLSFAQTDSVRLSDVVVTGTRYQSDIRHLPLDVSVISRSRLTAAYQPSVLPTLSQQVPGLFITTRGILGYGLSTGAAGTIKMRGIGGSADLLVLIDGLPQYAGLYGHPLADTYQTMLADRVEVVSGPASAIYGSNAMGGVVNIVTRQMRENGVRTNVNLQGGSYGTFIGTATNRMRQGRFSSIAAVNYERTDGHRPNSGFSQTSGFVKARLRPQSLLAVGRQRKHRLSGVVQSRSCLCCAHRQRHVHHARHGNPLAHQRLWSCVGCRARLLQLGPPPHQRRPHRQPFTSDGFLHAQRPHGRRLGL